MKIAYITSSSFVDTDFPLIRQLVKNGHNIELFINIHPNGLRSTLFDIKEQYPESGIFDSSIYGDAIDFYKNYLGIEKIYVINHLSNGITKSDFLLTRKTISMIKQLNPDIVQYVSWPTISDILLSFVFRNKLLITIHDPLPHEINRQSKKFRRIRLATNWFIKHYMLLNNSQTEEFKRYYRIPDSKIHFASIGNIEVMKLFGKETSSQFRTILFYGRISQYKGVDYLLKAFRQIEDKYEDVKLIIAGKGDFHFDITPYLTDPKIEFINRFITLEEMGTLIRNCEFAVCPYISATQSGVVASIHALNKPVIVTNVGGLSKMVEDGKTGLVVPPSNVEALSCSISKLLDDKTLLDSMHKNIKDSAEKGNNSWSNISHQYEEVYKIITKSYL